MHAAANLGLASSANSETPPPLGYWGRATVVAPNAATPLATPLHALSQFGVSDVVADAALAALRRPTPAASYGGGLLADATLAAASG